MKTCYSLLSVFCLIALALSTPQPLNAQDSNEPNETAVQATPLTIGVEKVGTIGFAGDLDFYSFEISESGIVEIGVTGLPGLAWQVTVYDGLQVVLYNINGNVAGTGNPVNVLLQVEPGEYFVRLRSYYNYTGTTDPYSILVATEAADPNELNNSFETATPIEIDQEMAGSPFPRDDEDYYRFEIDQAGVVEVFVSSVDNARMWGGLYNVNQTEIVGGWGATSGPLNFIRLLDAGVYYFRIYVGTETSREQYRLNITLDTSDPHEMNNTFATATPISADEEVVGAIRTSADKDVYKFEVKEAGTVRAVLLDVPPNIDMYLGLHGPTQQRIDWIRGATGGAIDKSFGVTTPGTHYIWIEDYGNNNYGPGVYRLSVSGAPVGIGSTAATGDVGNNGVVDAGDASLVLQSVVGLITLSGQQRVAADVDLNDFVQAADASYILQYVVGLIPELPVNSPGKMPALSSIAEETHIVWGDVEHDNDGRWKIPIAVEGSSTGIYAAEASVSFDPALVQFESFETTLPDDWMIAGVDDGTGAYRLAIAGTSPLEQTELGYLWVRTSTSSDHIALSGSARINTDPETTLGEALLSERPEAFVLEQNYPNPFNPNTYIEYALPEASFVRLSIYNMLGQEVAILVSEDQAAGYFQITWDASEVPSGMYVYRLEAGDFSKSRVLTVLK